MKKISEKCRPFAYDELLCESCDRKYHTIYEHPQWFCFGVPSEKSLKMYKIPEFDKLRLCIRRPPPLRELTVKGLFSLNPNKQDVQLLINGLSELLGAARA